MKCDAFSLFKEFWTVVGAGDLPSCFVARSVVVELVLVFAAPVDTIVGGAVLRDGNRSKLLGACSACSTGEGKYQVEPVADEEGG